MHIHSTAASMFALSVLLLGLFTSVAHADHAWAPYHWARTTNPFTISMGDSVSAAWDPYLRTAAADWSLSSVLDVSIVASGKSGLICKPVVGRGEVCNAKYGSKGWLGIAQIWVSGEHITQGTVKMNDTYFTKPAYNTAAWKNLVMCQEVGHLFGLGHQDENMTNPNLNTCMDYTNTPASNQHPNQHDYDMLETIYAHLDSSTTLSQTSATKPQLSAAESEDPRAWGREIRRSDDGRAALFERDFGGGMKIFTHVFWVEGEGHDHEHDETVFDTSAERVRR